jgi:molecular chaperone DnaJ
MGEDLYKILRVPKNADKEQIKRAYRKLAKEQHPDLQGCQNNESFLKAREAYETLCDEKRRKAYDRKLRNNVPVSRTDNPPVREETPHPFQEPSFHRNDFYRESFRSSREEPFSSARTSKNYFSFFDRVIERLCEEMLSPGIARQRASLPLEIVLSPQEAAQGGTIQVPIPVPTQCPYCRNASPMERFFCRACDGSGVVEHKRNFPVTIPAQVKNQSHLRFDLSEIGLEGTRLDVTVIVSA